MTEHIRGKLSVWPYFHECVFKVSEQFGMILWQCAACIQNCFARNNFLKNGNVLLCLNKNKVSWNKILLLLLFLFVTCLVLLINFVLLLHHNPKIQGRTSFSCRIWPYGPYMEVKFVCLCVYVCVCGGGGGGVFLIILAWPGVRYGWGWVVMEWHKFSGWFAVNWKAVFATFLAVLQISTLTTVRFKDFADNLKQN